MRRVTDWLVDRPLVVGFATLLVFLLGAFALSQLPIERDPDVQIPYVIAHVAWPAATPADVERELAEPIEQEMRGLAGTEWIETRSFEGHVAAVARYREGTVTAEARRDVQEAVDRAIGEIRRRVPEVEDPFVYDIWLAEAPCVLVSVVAEEEEDGAVDVMALKEVAEDLGRLLERVEGVREVPIFGAPEPEVRVRADPQRLAAHGLTMTEVVEAVEQWHRDEPAGRAELARSEVPGPEREVLVRLLGEVDRLDRLGTIPVRDPHSGATVRLDEVAEVVPDTADLEALGRFNGQRAVTCVVERRRGINTLATVAEVKEIVAEYQRTLPEGIRLYTTQDTGKEIRMMAGQLGSSALYGGMLVTVLLVVLVGWRNALLVVLAIPFTILSTGIGLLLLDMTVNAVTLFGLIVILGLVIDGAVIVGENIYRHMEEGKSPNEAAKIGIHEVGPGIIAADVTTIVAFFPILYLTGSTGEYMAPIPIVVILALTASIIVDHFVLPPFSAQMLARLRRRRGSAGLGSAAATAVAPGQTATAVRTPRLLEAVRAAYGRFLRGCMRVRWGVYAIVTTAFALGLAAVLGGVVGQEYMPHVDRSRFFVHLEMPVGTPIEETARVVRKVEAAVEEIAAERREEVQAFAPDTPGYAGGEIETYLTSVGDTNALNSDIRENTSSGPHTAKVQVELIEVGHRSRSQHELLQELYARLPEIPGARLRVEEVYEGPPAGAPVALRLTGESFAELDRAANELVRLLNEVPGTRDVDSDYRPAKPEFWLRLDRERAEELGVSAAQAARLAYTVLHGERTGRWPMGEEDAEIRVEAEPQTIDSAQALRMVPVRSVHGGLVPLSEVASLELGSGAHRLVRRDGQRTVVVRSELAHGARLFDVQRDIERLVADSEALEQLGIYWVGEGRGRIGLSFEGETEERDRTFAELFTLLVIGLVCVCFVLVIYFNSLRLPLLILMTVPLGFVGVIVGLLVTGNTFNTLSFLGIVALTGIVVNDAIVMVNCIRHRRRDEPELAWRDVVISAAKTRLRPVFVTTVTTAGGLIPLAQGWGGGGEFWQPLAYAIIFGICAATLLTLIVLPVLVEHAYPERRHAQQ